MTTSEWLVNNLFSLYFSTFNMSTGAICNYGESNGSSVRIYCGFVPLNYSFISYSSRGKPMLFPAPLHAHTHTNIFWN